MPNMQLEMSSRNFNFLTKGIPTKYRLMVRHMIASMYRPYARTSHGKVTEEVVPSA